MTFNTQPSAEFIRLRARWNELWKQRLNLELSDEEQRRVLDQMDQVRAALNATPEQQFLDEVQAAEFQAWDQTMAVELARRGRMMSMLAFSPESPNIDYAITHQEFASTAGDASLPEPLTIIADMRMMTAAQVARCLRAMADHVEESRLAVYRGPWPDGSGDEWWVDERADGTLRHSRS